MLTELDRVMSQISYCCLLSMLRCTEAEVTLLAVPRICMCFINWSEAYCWLRSDCARRGMSLMYLCWSGGTTSKPWLGLEHVNKAPKRSRFNYLEKAIKIYNWAAVHAPLFISINYWFLWLVLLSILNLLSRPVFMDCRYLTNRKTLSFVNLWQTTKYLFTVEVETF